MRSTRSAAEGPHADFIPLSLLSTVDRTSGRNR
jgi:hypothetical protein